MATKTSPGLAAQEALFSNAVAKGTGFDPRVIYAQAQSEGAYAPGGTGGLNFLNLKSDTVRSLGLPFAGSSTGGFAQFANLAQAENATIAEYRSPTIGLTAPAPTVSGEISQIAATPWDQTHYGGTGGPNLAAQFKSLYGDSAFAGKASTSNTSVLGSSPSGLFNPSTGAALNPPPSGLQTATGWFDWITNPKNLQRLGEIVGGSALIGLGLIMVGRAASSSGPAQQVQSATGTVAAPVRTITRSSSPQPTRPPRKRQTSRLNTSGRPISQSSARTRRAAGFEAAGARKPKRGAPGSKRLARGDTIPF